MKRLSIIIIVLVMISVADADLSLTLNGLDAAKTPLEIDGKDNLVIAVAGQSDAKAQNISVTCNMGKLEPLSEPNTLAENPHPVSIFFNLPMNWG